MTLHPRRSKLPERHARPRSGIAAVHPGRFASAAAGTGTSTGAATGTGAAPSTGRRIGGTRRRPLVLIGLAVAVTAANGFATAARAADGAPPASPSTDRGDPGDRGDRGDRIAAAIQRHQAAADEAARTRRPVDALEHWAAIARLDSSREDAWRRLHEDAVHPPPLASPALAAARADLPRGFREERTSHFVVLTDTDSTWSLEVARRLERAYTDFDAFARRVGLDATPLRHRLVCIVFDRKRDFERFGREADGVAVSWAHGYYSPRRDRVVLYNPASAGDRFAEARALAALMHETTHQLSYHRMVQDTTVQYPLWLTEGLATSFESDADASRAGPWESFGPRERRLARLVADDRLLPLAEFVGLASLGRADAERIELVYGQCYGLFSWLVTTRPSAVRAFLEAMHDEPPGAVAPERLVALFQTHVGTLPAIEAAWSAHLRDRAARAATAFGPRRAPGAPDSLAAAGRTPRLMLAADPADPVDATPETSASTEG